MASPTLQTLHLAHLPPDLAVHVALYTDLQNAQFLREQLLAGNAEFEYAFIDAGVILSTTHVLAAVFRAANDYLMGRLRTRNVHSEIVFGLGVNNNISHSLSTFGLTPTTTSLLAIKLSTAPHITRASVAAHLQTSIEGTNVAFCDEMLGEMADVGRIRKVYRLGGGEGRGRGKGMGGGAGKGKGSGSGDGDGDGEEERKELEVAILGVMALRGAG